MPKTIVKDQATAEFAARNLGKGEDHPDQISEPNAPKKKTTSEKLFPEFVADDGTVVNRPIKPYEDSSKSLPATETPKADVPTQTPPTTAPTASSYLKPEELMGKMAKVKVDGIESDVPAESLLKNYQLERHLNAQLMTLAEERRKLESERASLLRQPPPKLVVEGSDAPRTRESQSKRSEEVEALESRIAEMQAQMMSFQQTMLPAIQESGIKRVEQMAKERLGTDDFRAYFEKVRAKALEESSKPEVISNPQARAYYDSDSFYFETYKEMKLKDVLSKPMGPVAQNAPALVTQEGAPVIINNSGRPVSIPSLESSGGVPSKVNVNGDWSRRAQDAFDLARQTGRTEDWVDYYKIKSSSPN